MKVLRIARAVVLIPLVLICAVFTAIPELLRGIRDLIVEIWQVSTR